MDVFQMHSECDHEKSPSVVLFVLGNVVRPIWEWFIRQEKDTLWTFFQLFFYQKVVNLFYIDRWTEKLNCMGQFVEGLVAVNKKSVQQF